MQKISLRNTRTILALSMVLWFSWITLVHAESVVWSSNLGDVPFLSARWKDAKADKGWMRQVQVSVQYDATVTDQNGTVVPCGSSVPKGTVLDFRTKPHVNEDVYWFATGNFNDSPYGVWIPGVGAPQNMCSTAVNVTGAQSDGDRTHAMYVVSPPNVGIDGLTSQSCSGSATSQRCTMNAVGETKAAFRFEATDSYLYAANSRNDTWVCWSGPAKPNTASKRCQPQGCETNVLPPTVVPQQTIVCPITVTDTPQTGGGAPATPSLSQSGGACIVGQPHTISFTSTDPDGDTLRYGVDWNTDGSIDQWVPGSGYVPSGTTQSASRIYSTGGAKTVKVLAQDSTGAYSTWATLSFECTVAGDGAQGDTSAGTGGFNGNGNNGNSGNGSSSDLNIRAIPSLVSRGATTKVHWSTNNMTACTVTGSNADTWSGITSPVGGSTSSAITDRVVYTLSCTNAATQTFTKQAVVNILPSWKER